MKLKKYNFRFRVKCKDGHYRTGTLRNCGYIVRKSKSLKENN